MRPTVIIAALLLTSTGESQTLTAAQARAHEGENAIVCGNVASERTATDSRGKPTFINLDSAYPDAIFTIVIWEEDRQKVGVIPPLRAHMCAKGLIVYYHGVPEIIVRSSAQISP
jgi:hypothetical protein